MVHSKTKQPSHRSSAPALGHPETAWNKRGYSLQVNYQHRGFYSAVPCPRVVNEPTKTPNTRNSQAIDSPPLAQLPNVDFGKNYSIAVESIQEFIKVQRKKTEQFDLELGTKCYFITNLYRSLYDSP